MVEWIPGNRLKIKVEKDPVRLPGWMAAAVDRYWEETVKDRPHFFRGPVLTTTGVHKGRDAVTIRCAFTDFAHYWFSKTMHDGDRFQAHPLFAAAVPITTDGKLIFARMGENTARPHRIQAVGGMALPEEVSAGTFLAETSAVREMVEEIGMDRADLASPPQTVGATLDEDGSVAVAVRCALALSEAELKERVERFWEELTRLGQDPELEALIALPWGQPGVEAVVERGLDTVRYVSGFLTAAELKP